MVTMRVQQSGDNERARKGNATHRRVQALRYQHVRGFRIVRTRPPQPLFVGSVSRKGTGRGQGSRAARTHSLAIRNYRSRSTNCRR